MQGAAARKRKQLLQEFNISNAAQAGEKSDPGGGQQV
jgi:hypothetical protein